MGSFGVSVLLQRVAAPAVTWGVLLAAGVFAFPAAAQSPGKVESSSRLPGATAVIRAAEYPSLQAALDALPESGGMVVLPPGTFEIDQPLVLSRADAAVRGSGTATQIVNRNEEGQPALIVQHPDGENVARADRLWRVSLSDFRITGNPDSGTGIHAEQINEIFLHGVTVSHHGGDGIRLNECYEDPRVSDCLITYNGEVGLKLLGCHDIVVSGNQFEENQDALHCLDGFNLCMTGNCLDDHLQHGVVIENTYGSVVSGNMIEECQGTALIMDRDCYGNTVSANVIAHNGAGVDLRDAHGCSVSANTFTINKTDAVRVAEGSGRITISANNFSDSYLGGGEVKRAENDRAAAGLVLEGTSHVSVTGNVFSGLRPKGVDLRDRESTGVMFSGNVFVDAPSDYRPEP